MEQYLKDIFAGSSFLILTGLIAAAFFFAMAGLREIRDGSLEGLLYLALSLFFALAHLFLLFNTTAADGTGRAFRPDRKPIVMQGDLKIAPPQGTRIIMQVICGTQH